MMSNAVENYQELFIRTDSVGLLVIKYMPSKSLQSFSLLYSSYCVYGELRQNNFFKVL